MSSIKTTDLKKKKKVYIFGLPIRMRKIYRFIVEDQIILIWAKTEIISD